MQKKTIIDYISSLENREVIDYKNPKCIDCNDCCTMTAALTDKEYKTIYKYLTTDPNGIVLYKRAINILQKHLKEGTLYMICPLSLDSKKCGIYRIRPKACRDFHCSKKLDKTPKIEDLDLNLYSKRKSILNLFINTER